MDTLPDVVIHAPGTSAETDEVLRRAVAGDGLHYVRVVEQTNTDSFRGARPPRRTTGVGRRPSSRSARCSTRCWRRPTDRDVTVLYAHRVRPFDAAHLPERADLARRRPRRAVAGRHLGPRASPTRCVDVPHRLLALGTRRTELRHYGSPAEHQRAHGLDAAGIRRSVDSFLAA